MPNAADGTIANAVAADVDSSDHLLISVDGVLKEITTAELAQVAEFSSRYVVVPTAWVGVTFTNSWANFGSGLQAVQYRKEGDVVRVRGAMAGGTMSASAFTLPVGFRPPADFYKDTDSAGVHGRYLISTSGTVTPGIGSNTIFWIDVAFSVTA